ncbi:MAG: hypothetical protein EXX96DRAFT_565144 [Benjaminiella poitrasii]|nr:MAG: hypothetical protein EXX96DRAFT_565144 [Benjaminiella poitrasii]
MSLRRRFLAATSSCKNSNNKNKNNKKPNEDHLRQLLELFPTGDPNYFRWCLDHYEDRPVERIAEKIVIEQGGHFPQRPSANTNYLNACLRILALDIFPDCDVSFLRDQLLRFTFAHVEQVVESRLTSNDGPWPERLEYGQMDPSDGIRTDQYKRQAESQLIHDFPQVWKSSIRAVLVENNWDYLKSHDQLKEMGSGDFWKTLKNLFSHWSSSFIPDRHEEITDDDLKQQLREQERGRVAAQVEQDRVYADEVVNREEYERLMTCGCCYGDDFTFEQLIFCSEGEHGFCHECVRRFVCEGLFGQGSLRGQPRIACISSSDECQGSFSNVLLQTRVLSADIWMAYENSLLESYCQEIKEESGGQSILQCCRCPYFELDNSTRPLREALLSCTQHNRFLRIITTWLMSWQSLKLAHDKVARSRRGILFNCGNPKCKTVTCLECQRPVRGAHKCWEKETTGLRLYIEKAMVDAVKRTCPNCFLSFQKSDGCNKIVCRCGYSMCYVCRKDIGKGKQNETVQ